MNTPENNFDITKEAALLKAKLPALPKRPRKNLFDILKIQHREIRNTNILAYFLDPNEEHGFGSLFYDALLEIMVDKVTSLQTTHPHIPFVDISLFDEIKTVRTEEQTNGAIETAKSIDIVLEGNKWVIGIENKINHNLVNPLGVYWEHLQSKYKYTFGIVLSLRTYTPEECKANDRHYFLNITHQELLEGVQNNIQLSGDTSSTDLFYLREYFKNIESHYHHLKERPEMDTIVHEIVKNYDAVSEILKMKEEAEKHLEAQIIEVFAQYDYVKSGKWFRRDDRRFDLYFYTPPASDLMKSQSIWLYFEIRNETNKRLGNADFKTHFQNEFKEQPNFRQDYMEIKKNHTHAFIYFEHQVFDRPTSFKETFLNILERLINTKDAPVKKVEEYLEERKIFKMIK